MAGKSVSRCATVVIAMDDSEFAEYALEFYTNFMHKPENTVLLVHVMKVGSMHATLFTVPDWNPTPKLSKEEEKHAEVVKDKLEALMIKHDLDARVEITRGDYGPSICTVANRCNATYIVVGCRGRGTVSKIIKDSITDYVAHHSNIPVVIARSKDQISQFKHTSKGRRFSIV